MSIRAPFALATHLLSVHMRDTTFWQKSRMAANAAAEIVFMRA